MSNDLNQCNFIGRLGADPEMQYTAAGMAIAHFRIAVGRKYKEEESTEWVRCTAFGKLAEIIEKYLEKGKQVFITGRMQTSEYEKDGIKRYSTEIIVNEMQMLGGKGDGASNAPAGGGFRNKPQTPAQAPAPAQTEAFQEDDIPF